MIRPDSSGLESRGHPAPTNPQSSRPFPCPVLCVSASLRETPFPKGALIALIVLLASLNMSMAADQIELHNGKPVLGKIQKETATEVTIQATAGTQTIPVNRIVEIRYEGQGATMTQAKILEESYNLPRAAEEFAKAQGDLKDKPLVLQAAQFGQARVLAKLALDEATGRDEAIARLEKFARENSASRHHFPLYELLGRLYFDKDDFGKAAQAFDQLAEAPWPETKLRAALYHGRLLLAQKKIDQAIARFDEVLAAAGESPESALVPAEALFEKARCLRARSERAAEIEILLKTLDQTPARAGWLQAEAYIALGDAYRAVQKPRDALVAYLHVDLLFAKNKELHPRALYNLMQLWSELGQPERAAAAQSTLKTDYPNTAWTKKIGS